jgi:probable rRNA maturation factor
MILDLQAAPGERLPLGVRAPLRALGARLRPGALRVQIVAAGDPLVRRLNREFRGMDRSTDVLSFVYESKPRRDGDGVDAEIYISIPVAKRQARQRHHALREEFLILALHGLLHIQGYDHHAPADERRMRAAEQRHLRWFESIRPQWKPRPMLGSPRQQHARW